MANWDQAISSEREDQARIKRVRGSCEKVAREKDQEIARSE